MSACASTPPQQREAAARIQAGIWLNYNLLLVLYNFLKELLWQRLSKYAASQLPSAVTKPINFSS